MVSFLFIILEIFHLWRLTSAQLNGCISDNTAFVCMRLNSITDLKYTTSHRIYAELHLNVTTLRSTATQYIESKTTTSTTVNDMNLVVCVPTLISYIDSISRYQVTFKNRDKNDGEIGTLYIANLVNTEFNISTIGIDNAPSTYTLTDTSYFTAASNTIASAVTVSLSIWLYHYQSGSRIVNHTFHCIYTH